MKPQIGCLTRHDFLGRLVEFRQSQATQRASVAPTESVPRTGITRLSYRNRTCTFPRYYRDTARSDRSQGTLRRSPSFSGVPEARGHLAKGRLAKS